MFDLIVKGGTLPDGRVADIGIRGDRIAAVESLAGAEAGRVIDATGDLVSPPFVDPHFHMDATLSYGQPRINASGTLLEGISLWGELRDLATIDEMVERALTYCDWAVSTGLLEQMTAEEAEAVLGHEVSHVANGDMVTLALIQGVLNTFVIALSRVVGYLVDQALSSRDQEYRGPGIGYWITSMVMEVVFGLLASLVVMWFSRWREFHADAGGAELAGRGKMIAALERLRQLSEPSQLPSQMAAFGINGGLGDGLRKLFMTHPPLEERIEALRRRA